MNVVSPILSQPLNSRQLLAFVTVARTRSFTLAGKELFLSQSAISHALTSLEVELDCRLFDRDGKKLQITPAGEHLLHYAEKILADMALARGSLEQRSRWGTSRLRVAVDAFFGPCLLPDVLKSFRRKFPDWPISVKEGESRECVEWLAQNAVDVAIAMAPSRAEAVELVPLFTDELAWIVAPRHPWAQIGCVNIEEISAQKFICNSAASYTSRLLEKYFERDGIRLNWELELTDLEAIKEMVKEGTCVAALAPWAVRKELDEKSLIALPLGKRKLKRNWCLLWSLDRKPRLAEETFAKFCRDAANALSVPTGIAAMVTHVLWLAGVDFGCLDFNILAVVV